MTGKGGRRSAFGRIYQPTGRDGWYFQIKRGSRTHTRYAGDTQRKAEQFRARVAVGIDKDGATLREALDLATNELHPGRPLRHLRCATTFAQLVLVYLDDLKGSRRKPSTINHRTACLTGIITRGSRAYAAWTGDPLVHLEAADVRRWVNFQRAAGLRDSSIKRRLAECRLVLNWGVADEIVPDTLPNPFSPSIAMPDGCEPVREQAALLAEEARELLDQAAERLDMEAAALIVAAVHTGWRYGQLRQLRWEDVDWCDDGSGRLRMPATLSKARGRSCTTFGYGRLQDALQALRAKRGAHPTALVFVQASGEPWAEQSTTANVRLREALRGCMSIPDEVRHGKGRTAAPLSFHGLRRTFRCVGFDAGVHEATLDSMADWSSPRNYAGRGYLRRFDVRAREAAQTIAETLLARSETKPKAKQASGDSA